MLLNGRFSPLTFGIGFWEAPNKQAVDSFIKWISTTPRAKDATIQITTIVGDLETVFRAMFPLVRVSRTSYLFIGTRTSWTAFFDNSVAGADLNCVPVLCERMNCRAVRVDAVKHTLKKDLGTSGCTQLSVFKPETQTGKSPAYTRVRWLYCGYEAKWEFLQDGVPYPFENTANYSVKPIRDRFTPAMLSEYLQHFDIELFDKDFYVATKEMPAHIVHMEAPWMRNNPDWKEFGIEEVQKRYVDQHE